MTSSPQFRLQLFRPAAISFVTHRFENMMHNLLYLFCKQKKKKKQKTRLIPGLNDKKFAEDKNATTPSFKICCDALQSLKLGGFRCYKKLCSGSTPLYVDAHGKHLLI